MKNEKEYAHARMFEKNLMALDKRYPELSKKLHETAGVTSKYIIHPDTNNEFMNILLNNENINSLYYDSKDPLGYSRRYIESLDLKYAPFLIFLGFGLGYQVISALNGFSKKLKIRHIFIVEKDIRFFEAALKNYDFSQIIMHPDIEFFIGKQPQELYFEFRNYIAKNPGILEFGRSLKFIIMPAVHFFEKQYYNDVYNFFKNAIMHVFQHLGNDPYDALLGVYQTISNIRPFIADPGIIAFKDAFKSKPGIVIGAGPSLNKNIHLLKEARSKAVLIAVDAALKPLLDIGIRPHIVTNIERTAPVNAFFLNLGKQDDIYFVFSPVAAPETYNAYDGPKIIAHRYKEIMDWLDMPKGALSGSPLVGNFAFDIAQYLGCSPIIMAGQDLSFKPSEATHVKGHVFGHVDEYKTGTIEIEGNYNELLHTTQDFYKGKKSLEIQIKNFDGLCINATEGGARIDGAILLSLRQAIDAYCKETIDPSYDLKRIWSKENDCQKDPAGEIKRVCSIVDKSVLDLDSAIGDCKKGIELIDAVLKRNQLIVEDKPNPKLVQKINVITKELNEIRTKIISHPSFVTFEMVIQGYHFDLEMRRNMAYDRFYNPEFAELKSFLLLKEWFNTIGQLILSTKFALLREKTNLMLDIGSATYVTQQ